MRKVFAFLIITIAIQSCQNGISRQVTVENILNNPTAYINQGIKLQGVVSLLSSGKQQFNIIGEKEFEDCKIGECNANKQLPIRFKNGLPKVGDKVEVSGQIIKTKEGFIHEAKSIRHIKSISGK